MAPADAPAAYAAAQRAPELAAPATPNERALIEAMATRYGPSQQKPTADVDADFASSWARSDTWIRASRF